MPEMSVKGWAGALGEAVYTDPRWMKRQNLSSLEEFVLQDSFHCRFVVGYTVTMAFGPAARIDASLFVLHSRPEGL